MQVWDDIQQACEGKTYRELLEEDARSPLTAQDLDTIFDPQEFLKRIDIIFDRLEVLEF
jgi:adenylosuccinate lyase